MTNPATYDTWDEALADVAHEAELAHRSIGEAHDAAEIAVGITHPQGLATWLAEHPTDQPEESP